MDTMEEPGTHTHTHTLSLEMSGCDTYAHSVSLSLPLSPTLPRVQTGKLSDFLTTSCFAHLSFLDGKARGGGHGGADADEDLGSLHELPDDDGKEEEEEDGEIEEGG